MKEISLEQAQEVHRRLTIVDGHNDTPVERIARKERPLNWMQRDPAYHMDVPRMIEGGFTAGFFVVGNGKVADVRATTEQTLAQIDAHPDRLRLVRKSSDVEEARSNGQIGILMTIEGAGRWLDGDLDVLRMYYRLGVRCLGITHGEGGGEPGMLQGTRSPFGPCTTAERAEGRKAQGLTSFGREVLQECNRLGMVTDLSHINDTAFYEVLELSALPTVMTHTASFSQCGHWRCLTDEQLKALAATGGVMGIAFVPSFIDIDPERATIDRLVEHVCTVADLVGIDHVGIGSDYDGMGKTIPVVPDVSQLVHLTRSLLAHGLTEEEVAKVWGGNFTRILRKTIDL